MRRKIINIAIIILFFSIQTQGQYLAERYVFNSTGTVNVVGTMELISSMGEVVIDETNEVMCGFLQNDLISGTFNEVKLKTTPTVQVFPNPATSHFELVSAVATIGTVAVLNQDGQILFFKNINKKREQIDLNYISSGVYFLKISDVNGTLMEIKKIIKIND